MKDRGKQEALVEQCDGCKRFSQKVWNCGKCGAPICVICCAKHNQDNHSED